LWPKQFTSLTFHWSDKYLKEQLKREQDVFYLIGSEVSVCGWLAPQQTGVLGNMIPFIFISK
jgi:hypothetical protein